ncbi:hypothetical protein RYH80_19055 [Halobaculum sp. MBLA0147]|uniref:hypothetical protein n=1 Tax=Halobaculum sp. MBLA0147 TaxID=3079934 RepID=UPI00352438A5
MIRQWVHERLRHVNGPLVAATGVVTMLAAGSLWYGVQHDDIVTALGALLFFPAAALLAGISLRPPGGFRRGGTA